MIYYSQKHPKTLNKLHFVINESRHYECSLQHHSDIHETFTYFHIFSYILYAYDVYVMK